MVHVFHLHDLVHKVLSVWYNPIMPRSHLHIFKAVAPKMFLTFNLLFKWLYIFVRLLSPDHRPLTTYPNSLTYTHVGSFSCVGLEIP